ncbi:MAG: hypothetical protein AB1631_22180 [Acidobacteriota bacterium]
MRATLQRQAGVEKANYRAGVVEIEANAQTPFEVKKVLSVLKDELGFDPVKEIEVTVVGRVNIASKEWTVRPKNSGDSFLLSNNEQLKRLKATEGIQDQEVKLSGKLGKPRNGRLVLMIDSFERNDQTQ